MLKVMQKHQKYFYFLFFLIIISFIGWGVGTVDKTSGTEVVAEVGKYKITSDEYWKSYDRVFRFYREIYKDKFNEQMEKNLKEDVLNSMINERVLLITAKEMDIGVTDEELQDSIARDPVFMKNGVFDKEVYINRLKLNRMIPEAFESLKRQELTLNKMRRFIELSAIATDMDAQTAQPPGNEQSAQTMNQMKLNETKEKAVRSYIEGLKKNIKIKINKKLIA